MWNNYRGKHDKCIHNVRLLQFFDGANLNSMLDTEICAFDF